MLDENFAVETNFDNLGGLEPSAPGKYFILKNIVPLQMLSCSFIMITL